MCMRRSKDLGLSTRFKPPVRDDLVGMSSSKRKVKSTRTERTSKRKLETAGGLIDVLDDGPHVDAVLVLVGEPLAGALGLSRFAVLAKCLDRFVRGLSSGPGIEEFARFVSDDSAADGAVHMQDLVCVACDFRLDVRLVYRDDFDV